MASENHIQLPKVAVCGEVNSGKTSFVNSLFLSDFVPELSALETKPIVRIIFDDVRQKIRLTDWSGKTRNVLTCAQIPDDGSVADIEIHANIIPEIGPFELIEFPPLRDGHLDRDQIDAIAECDVFVWMTIGSQAWRLSEKTVVEKINVHPGKSLLVVSRADKFRSQNDSRKLMMRLEDETSSLFQKGLLLHADPKKLAAIHEDPSKLENSSFSEISPVLAELIGNTSREVPQAEAPLGFRQRRRGSARRRTLSAVNARIGVSKPPTTKEPVAETAKPDPLVLETAASQPPAQKAKAAKAPVSEKTEASAVEKTEAAEVAPEPVAVKESATVTPEKNAENDGPKIDGLVALLSFNPSAPEKFTLHHGEKDRAQDLAINLSSSINFIRETEVYEAPETVVFVCKSLQVAYQFRADSDDILMLACRSSNAGMVQTTLARLAKDLALEAA